MMITRPVNTMGMVMGIEFGVADIKGDLMQRGPERRETYIITPESHIRRKQVYWNLLELEHGLYDAGRQWL